MSPRSRAWERWLTPSIRDTGSPRRLAPGDLLYRRGDPALGLYQVLRGRVRLSLTATSGRELVLQTAAAGETLAETALFSDTYQCDAAAVTDSEVVMYAKTAILAEFERNPQSSIAFMTTLADKIAASRSRLERHHLRSARDRVRHYLASNVGPDGRTVPIEGSLKDLALDLGLTHEALYRAIGELVASGEIKRSRSAIQITGHKI